MNFGGVVNRNEPNPSTSDVAYVAWKIKDSKARSDIILHCGNTQLSWVHALPTSKEVWDK